MTMRQTIDYIWLAQAFLRLLPWSVDPEVTRMVRTGDVLYERLRPVDAHTFWYARAVALRTASPLLRAIPLVLLTGILFPLIGLAEWALSPPAGSSAALLFAGSMALTVALAAAISTILDIVTVATLSDRGVNTVIGPIVIVLSGSLAPSRSFPIGFNHCSPSSHSPDWSTRPFASTAGISPVTPPSPLSLFRRSGRSSSSHSAT